MLLLCKVVMGHIGGHESDVSTFTGAPGTNQTPDCSDVTSYFMSIDQSAARVEVPAGWRDAVGWAGWLGGRFSRTVGLSCNPPPSFSLLTPFYRVLQRCSRHEFTHLREGSCVCDLLICIDTDRVPVYSISLTFGTRT